jgi:hypothetical protein
MLLLFNNIVVLFGLNRMCFHPPFFVFSRYLIIVHRIIWNRVRFSILGVSSAIIDGILVSLHLVSITGHLTAFSSDVVLKKLSGHTTVWRRQDLTERGV